MKTRLILLMVGVLALLCSSAGMGQVAMDIRVRVAPPAVRIETPPPPPSPEHY